MQDGLLGATTARSEITAAVSVTNAESGNWNARTPPVFSPAATARSCTILQTIKLRCPERVHDLVVEANRPKRRPCTIGLHPIRAHTFSLATTTICRMETTACTNRIDEIRNRADSIERISSISGNPNEEHQNQLTPLRPKAHLQPRHY